MVRFVRLPNSSISCRIAILTQASINASIDVMFWHKEGKPMTVAEVTYVV